MSSDNDGGDRCLDIRRRAEQELAGTGSEGQMREYYRRRICSNWCTS